VHQQICRYLDRNFPHVDYITDYASSLSLNQVQQRIYKSLNSGRGWSDIFIAWPSRGYHGFFIEVKPEGTVIYNRDGTLRKQRVRRKDKDGYIVTYDHLQEQYQFLVRKQSEGYFGRFAIGYEAAKKLIDWYMQVPQNEELF
jgi:hypothetical protein